MHVPHDVLSLWGDEQIDLLLAYQAHRDSIGPHGFPMSVATDHGNRFVADLPETDLVEKARLDAEDAYRKRGEDVNMNGLIFRVRMVDPEEEVVDTYQFEGL